MDLIDPPIPGAVIASISSTMAHLYRIVPILRNGDHLTVAASHVVEQSVLDELRAFLGLTVQAVTVPDEDLNCALHRYYPDSPVVPPPNCIHVFPHPAYPRETERRQLLRRVIDYLCQSDVELASLRCSVNEMVASIRRHSEEEVIECFADGELGQRLVERLKVMAGIDLCDRSTQSGVIEISVSSKERCILVKAWMEDDVHMIELSRCGE